MINLDWPYALFLLPLPWLVRRFAPAVNRQQVALYLPFMAEILPMLPQVATSNQRRNYQLWLAFAAWICLVVAICRPLWIGDPISLPRSGRDLLLAVDLSGSMSQTDFQIGNQVVDRLTAEKAVMIPFIERRTGDRIGLILFGDQAYLQTPLTFDRKTVATLLNESAIGLAGRQTAIGDAIGLAVKRLKQSKQQSRVLILVTDGANTAGEVAPLKAAELAASEHLKIYTIGIGAEVMNVPSFFGVQQVNPSADLDDKTLTAIANQTGGRYFRARDSAELEQIYALLDKLEPAAADSKPFRPKQALYFWPLALGMLLTLPLFLWGMVSSASLKKRRLHFK